MTIQLARKPRVVRELRENRLETAIGHEVRAQRKRLGITVTDLAASTGLSVGMLSKIENGNISPSLTTLRTLTASLGVSLGALFRRYDEPRDAVFVKAGEGLELERRGTRAGHRYHLLGQLGDGAGGVVVEPYVIRLSSSSDAFSSFQHQGTEFIYMLEGAVSYRHGETLYPMRPGDSLYFDADAPHGPEVLDELPARYLSIICYAKV